MLHLFEFGVIYITNFAFYLHAYQKTLYSLFYSNSLCVGNLYFMREVQVYIFH